MNHFLGEELMYRGVCMAVTVLDDCQQHSVHELTDTGGFAQHSEHSISLSLLGSSLHFVLFLLKSC